MLLVTRRRFAAFGVIPIAVGLTGALPARAELRGLEPFLVVGVGLPIAIGIGGIGSAIAYSVDLQNGRPISKEGRGVGYFLGILNLSIASLESIFVATGAEFFGGYMAVASVVHLLIGSLNLGIAAWGSGNDGDAIPSSALAWFLGPSALIGVLTSIGNGIKFVKRDSLSKGERILGYSIGFLNAIAGSLVTVVGALDDGGRRAPLVGLGIGQVAVGVTNLIWAWGRGRSALASCPWFSIGPLSLMSETGKRNGALGLTLSMSRR